MQIQTLNFTRSLCYLNTSSVPGIEDLVDLAGFLKFYAVILALMTCFLHYYLLRIYYDTTLHYHNVVISKVT